MHYHYQIGSAWRFSERQKHYRQAFTQFGKFHNQATYFCHSASYRTFNLRLEPVNKNAHYSAKRDPV